MRLPKPDAAKSGVLHAVLTAPLRLGARVDKALDDARASYWFIPTMLVLAAIVLANAALFIDGYPSLAGFRPDWMIDLASAEGARSVVSVIAQSMIGVAGVMFSITMLAVSFASGQYGPRLIGNFMRDRGNQWTLGILISTFTFALLVLRSIENGGGDTGSAASAFVPHFAILLTMALAIMCVFVMIFHVHHVPETISVSNIIANLGACLGRDVAAMTGRETAKAGARQVGTTDLCLRSTGYIHNMREEQLSRVAAENAWTIEVLALPGEFVHPHRPVLRIWGASAIDDDTADALRGAVAVGRAKTEHQNVVFIAEQLVEIVARAMSPGVNDPFTAISCLDWMEAALMAAARSDRPLHVFAADRVVVPPLTFGELLARSLGDSLPYVMDDALARGALSDGLDRLVAAAHPANAPVIAGLARRLSSRGSA